MFSSVDRLRGPGHVEELFALLDPNLQRLVSHDLLVGENWYPIQYYRQLLGAVASLHGEGRQLIRAVGYDCCLSDLRGAYRFFARLLKPQTLFSGGMRLFKSYYDTGEVWVVAASERGAHALWKECHGFDANMWTEVVGACEAILELGGAKELDLRIVNGGKTGSSHMELKAHWT